VGQVELVVGKRDGRLKAHPVCPDEGSCHQKVITECRVSGHGLIRKFVVSRVEVETSKLDGPRTRSLGSPILGPCAISDLITVLSTVFRKKGWTSAGLSRDDLDLVTSGVMGTSLIT